MTVRVIEHLYHDPCRSIMVFSKSEVAAEHVTKDHAYGRSVHQAEHDELVAHEPN
jgi:hypothetical protein